MTAIIWIALCGLLAMRGTLPIVVYYAFLFLSVSAYVLYRADKRAASSGAWRTPESTLHLVAVLGGWPGALIARHQLHHKTRKSAFRITFWFTVFANCATVAWFASPGLRTRVFGLLEQISR